MQIKNATIIFIVLSQFLLVSCSGNSEGLIRLGSAYGGWTIPDHYLNEQSICYCVGNGEDISFDLRLIEKYGCRVFSFDPTPRAVIHVHMVHDTIARNETATTCHGIAYPRDRLLLGNYFFYPVGLWDHDGDIAFFMPLNPQHVSASITNIQSSDSYFTAPCKCLSTIMRELNHSNIDLLKIDIEGAEYAVIKNILSTSIRPYILCVEFHEAKGESLAGTMEKLQQAGYVLRFTTKRDYTFVYNNSRTKPSET